MVTKIKFMDKSIQVDYVDTNEVEHSIKSTEAPHPDFNASAMALVPHLLVAADMKKATLRIKSIEFNENDDGESITVTAQKLLEGGKVATISFPTMEVNNQLIQICEDLEAEAMDYASAIIQKFVSKRTSTIISFLR